MAQSGYVLIFQLCLNTALEDHCYPLPIPEDIFTILNGGTCFAKLDFRGLFTSQGLCSLQGTADNRHCSLFQYTTVTFWNENRPRYIPANHGHY